MPQPLQLDRQQPIHGRPLFGKPVLGNEILDDDDAERFEGAAKPFGFRARLEGEVLNVGHLMKYPCGVWAKWNLLIIGVPPRGAKYSSTAVVSPPHGTRPYSSKHTTPPLSTSG